MTNTVPKPEHVDVQYEGDLIFIRVRGVIDESVARYVQAIHDELALQVGYALQVQDCRHVTNLTPEARSSFFKWNRGRQYPGAVAIVGASFGIKTMAMLLGRAVKLLVTVPSEIDFFDTEAQARTWVEKQRPVFEKALASKNTSFQKNLRS